jgi:hypothetical protein
VSRRKRKERNEIHVFLNYKLLKQVNQNTWELLIINLNLESILLTQPKNALNLYSLSKSAKITWGLRHEVLKIIYEGAVLSLLLYGAPVWRDAMKCTWNRKNTSEHKERVP